jgi:TolB-like protein/Tfp pilus assembly protein PilF
MPDKTDNPINFWQELKRRKVVRVIIMYAVAAYVIIELVGNVVEPLNLPEWTPTLIIVLLVIGFPFAVIFSWIFDITPEGIVKTEPAKVAKEIEVEARPIKRKLRISDVIIAILIVVVCILIYPKIFKKGEVIELDKSIAVLPFIDDSPNKDNEHIINGIMEDLLINLQSIKDLRVPGRTSVEQYRNNPKPIPDIAIELGVNYIVEGSGQKYGNHYTLRVQLLEGGTGMHIWGQKFEQDLESVEDIVYFISSISSSIAGELEAIISPEEQQLIEKVPTTSLTAYHSYQKGEEEFWRYYLTGEAEALDRAEKLYNKALEYDSTFALVYTGLARVYGNKYYWETFLTEEFLDSALTLADIAISFDPQLSKAYVIRGNYYRRHNKKKHAINEYNKAIKFNPNDWEAYRFIGVLYHQDDYVKALENYHKAVSLYRGPLLPTIFRNIGFVYGNNAGFKEKAIHYVTEAFKLDDDSAIHFRMLAEIEESNCNFESYIGLDEKYLEYLKKYNERLKALDRPDPNGTFKLGHAYWVNGLIDEAEYYFNTGLAYFNKMREIDRIYGQDFFTSYNLAEIYAFLGDKNKAYYNLKIINQKPRMPLWMIKDLKYDPMFDNIRDEPEFQQIVRDVEIKYYAEHERVKQWLKENDR